VRRAVAVAIAAYAVLLALPAVAAADTVVPAGRTVAEVTVIGEDVILNGTSAGSVIVVDGDLTIGPRGRAGHGVTLIGGELSEAPGAQIHGDVFQVGGPIPHPTGWTLVAAVAGLLAARLAIVWLVLRIARILVSWPTTVTMLAASRRRPLRSVAVGALLAAGVLAAVILLALSVVGLVLALALAGVCVLAASLGVAFALRGVPEDSEHSTTVAIALVVPVVGDALLALATVVALGAAFHYLVDERSGHMSPVPAEP
jgi:hypothetical protein